MFGRSVALSAVGAFSLLFVAACGGGGSGAEGNETELTLSSPLTSEAQASRLVSDWSKRITACTDGSVTFDPFFSGSLLSTTDTFPGVAQGRADLGVSSPQYHESELPLTSFSGIPFTTSDIESRLLAVHELFETNSALQSEWTDMGLEPLLILPTGVNTIFSSQTLDGVDDLNGLSVRAVGQTATALEAAGADTSSIPFGEVYPAVEQGVVDAVSTMSMPIGQSTHLHEVAPHITDAGMGVYTLTTLVASNDLLEGFSSDVQGCFEQSTKQYYSEVGQFVEKSLDSLCQDLSQQGAQFDVWSDSKVGRFRDTVGGEIRDEWISSMEAKGLPGEQTLNDYLALTEEHGSDRVFGPAACVESGDQ